MVVAVRLRVCPAQSGPLLPAVGEAGILLMLTVVDAGTEEHPLAVTVTVYVPAKEGITLGLEGFCWVAENPFGPVHAKLPPDTLLAVRLRLSPTHNGPLLPTVGVAGTGFTLTYVV